MKDIAEMTYSEFTLLLSEDTDDRFQLILNYDDFKIYGEVSTGRYFYLESGKNNANDFFEVECLACLVYDVNHDLKITSEESGVMLSELFDCDVCGEAVNDDNIQYLWFKEKE